MRIGIITGEYPPMEGGVGAYTRILGQRLAQLGDSVYILTNTKGGQTDDTLVVNHQIKNWRSPNILNQIHRWSRQKRLDIINLQFQTAAFQMSPWIHVAPKWIDLPFVTTFHDLRVPYLFPKAGPLRRWIVHYLAHQSQAVIVTNHEDHAQLANHPRCNLVPIGSNIPVYPYTPTDLAYWRNQIGISEDDYVLGHFGFINQMKGVDTLINSLAILKKRGVPARLLMIGGTIGDSDPTNMRYLVEINRMISELGLSDSIYWTGYQDEKNVSTLLRVADVIVLPFKDGASYRRGSLMAAIEHECAIVTTSPNIRIASFLDGNNMCLTTKSDSEQLAATLQNLYQNPEQIKRLKAGARALRLHFDWEHIAQQTRAILASLARAEL